MALVESKSQEHVLDKLLTAGSLAELLNDKT